MNRNLYETLDGAHLSPAETYLADRLRTLKAGKITKDQLVAVMTKDIGGKSFTKAEANRLWIALNVIKYHNGQSYACGIENGHVTFPRTFYTNYSNAFQDYAKDLVEQGDIYRQRGTVKGFCSDKMRESMAKARAAKAAKKAAKETTEETPKPSLPKRKPLPPRKYEYNEATGDFVISPQALCKQAVAILQQLLEVSVPDPMHDDYVEAQFVHNYVPQMIKQIDGFYASSDDEVHVIGGKKEPENPLKEMSSEQLLSELCIRGFRFQFFEDGIV